MPIILNETLGFNVGESQLLTAPPYAFAGIAMFVAAWAGDKYRMKGPILLVASTIGIIGLAILVCLALNLSSVLSHLLTCRDRDGLPRLAFVTSVFSSSVPDAMAASRRSWRTKPTTFAGNGREPSHLQPWVCLSLWSLLSTTFTDGISSWVWWYWWYCWIDSFPSRGPSRLLPRACVVHWL